MVATEKQAFVTDTQKSLWQIFCSKDGESDTLPSRSAAAGHSKMIFFLSVFFINLNSNPRENDHVPW